MSIFTPLFSSNQFSQNKKLYGLRSENLYLFEKLTSHTLFFEPNLISFENYYLNFIKNCFHAIYKKVATSNQLVKNMIYFETWPFVLDMQKMYYDSIEMEPDRWLNIHIHYKYVDTKIDQLMNDIDQTELPAACGDRSLSELSNNP